MLLTKNKKVVLIYPDKITLEFLASLKVRRKMLNFTLRECSKKLGIVISNLNYYERGLSYPCLKNLIKLAEFYGADISGSINWKIYHGKINLKNLRQQKRDTIFRLAIFRKNANLAKILCSER
ncbi:MAG: helix-turn-helix transcriptional regulator [Synergistaceae bacterium]|nr:helix-turn-helix transcriptional regulator [Synergistaceae bacterium]MBR2208051.1 helix-turn-helix transcriptional regulator [Synergistaceae bacterium]